MVTKGKAFFVELNAKKAQKYAENIKSQAEKLKDEVTELFNNGGMKDGNKVANIIQQDDGVKLMEELASDGSLLRKSTFMDKMLEIEVSTKKGQDVFVFENGILLVYNKDLERLADGSKKVAKILQFNDDKLLAYNNGCEEFADGSKKVAKVLIFNDDKLLAYNKGYEEFVDGSEKAAKILQFEDGKLSVYSKNYN